MDRDRVNMARQGMLLCMSLACAVTGQVYKPNYSYSGYNSQYSPYSKRQLQQIQNAAYYATMAMYPYQQRYDYTYQPTASLPATSSVRYGSVVQPVRQYMQPVGYMQQQQQQNSYNSPCTASSYDSQSGQYNPTCNTSRYPSPVYRSSRSSQYSSSNSQPSSSYEYSSYQREKQFGSTGSTGNIRPSPSGNHRSTSSHGSSRLVVSSSSIQGPSPAGSDSRPGAESNNDSRISPVTVSSDSPDIVSHSQTSTKPAWQGKLNGNSVTRCHDGKILRFRQRCDKVTDCALGEDEVGCDWYKSSSVPSINTVAQLNTLLSPTQTSPVLVEFFTPWCPACVNFFPHLEIINREAKARGVVVRKVNTDEAPMLKAMFSINSFPTVILWNRKDQQARKYNKGNGMTSNNILAWMNNLLR